MRVAGHIGRCDGHGCGHATRTEDLAVGECPEHGRYPLRPIWGETTATACGAACEAATGDSCDCSCGGRNHGAAHAA